jgi:long-chain acyl-CoA synthetase
MLGYYKDPSATEKTIDKDGWYHTGDLGTMDAENNLFIRGRSKTMLLGSSGQNIYPEEIEDKLSSLALVNECLVIQDNQKLIGLVHPDYDAAKSLGLSNDDLKNIMEQNRQELNTQMPVYSKVAEIEIQKEEFQKTPKKSIKRYLYEK